MLAIAGNIIEMKYEIKKRLAMLLALIIVLSAASGCSKNENSSSSSQSQNASATEATIDTSFDAVDLDVGYDESSSCAVVLNGGSADISGSGAEFTDGNLVISAAGTYMLSGTVSDGQIIVDADKESDIKLVFKGVNVSCSDNSALFVNKANKVTITLEAGSENTLSDGTEYSLDEDTSNVDGAVFCRSDLTLNGSGSLNITANYKHGIVCKDDLVIVGGSYTVNAASGGIYGKDSIKINSGSFIVSAGTNGIKSSNTESADKGYIYINDGTFDITAGTDGIEAESVLSVENGTFNIVTGGGSDNASMTSDGQPNGDWGNWGGRNNNMTPPDGKTVPGESFGNMTPPDENFKEMTPPDQQNSEITAAAYTSEEYFTTVSYESSDSDTDSSESSSAKALKAGSELNIRGGEITVDSSDDSVHCNGNINISGGTLSAKSGDDGVHADGELLITGGTINIEKSYEGLEGVTLTISGGDISVTASDDGLNAGGGSDTGSSGRPGMDGFNTGSGTEYLLTISGGTLKVNASGDGLDSNGNLVIEGGEIYVSGPTNGGNGAIDYGDNASAWITGGTIAAFGSVGMEESFGENNSTQYSVLHNLSSTVSGDTEVVITDSSGSVILSYTPEKDWQSVVFSSPDIKDGETYTITAGSISETVTIDGICTSNSTSAGGFGGGRGGAMGFR
ncbi:carbohydrate-binding domain-containing protein [Ruminococcus sp. Marseille-P6503]|uniref:carbohydrate-binding domain-containing protein n=1 Tax=Ruminococcus sp. Marseille-P6503 TaxID=2364796 RepID=UPI000F521DF8|nr:carbohydrate-binding domain-containing protein [Ruminococcus sp. Marseille-P6503]